MRTPRTNDAKSIISNDANKERTASHKGFWSKKKFEDTKHNMKLDQVSSIL